MDAAFYPSTVMATKSGVLELIAAATSEEHMADVGRCTFSHVIAEQLRARASQNRPLTAAELHSILLARYPKVVQDRHPEREIVVSFPAPMHLQTSRNTRLPSVLLAPMTLGTHNGPSPLRPYGIYDESGANGTNGALTNGSTANGTPAASATTSPISPGICLSISMPDNALELDNWLEWLRGMPDGVRDVVVGRAFLSPA